MADLFDVLADPTRRDLLGLLLVTYVAPAPGSGEISVGEIVERLSLTQPTVSKHLKVLRDHGLVRVREEGQHRFYSLDAAPLGELREWLAPFLDADLDLDRVGVDALGSASAETAWAGGEVAQKVGRAVAGAQHQVVRRIQRIKAR